MSSIPSSKGQASLELPCSPGDRKRYHDRLYRNQTPLAHHLAEQLELCQQSFTRKEHAVLDAITAVQRSTLPIRMEVLAEKATYAILRRELSLEAILKPSMAQFKEARPNTPEEYERFVKPWVDHVFEVFAQGDQVVADYIMKWCAAPIQVPGHRNYTCLVVRGNQGLGKSMVG